MKKYFMLVVSSLLITSVFATVRTVSNFPLNVAQFNDINSAIAASSNGDTIYVHGSPNNYSSFTLNKQLVILGPGWSPDKQLPFNAVVSGATLNAGSSGSEIQGLDFASAISIATAGVVNNMRFVRNRFRSGSNINFNCCTAGTYTGYLFEGNWFENASINDGGGGTETYNNFIIQNNLFYQTNGSAQITGFVNTSSILINHNLFYGPSGAAQVVFSANCRFLTISNNIFVRRNAATSLSSSNFNNNITFNCGQDAPWTVNSNTDALGNIAGSDPQMVDQSSVNSGTDNPLLDFTIASGPANNSASDGKDIGLLYDAIGSLNWTNSRASRMPFIFSMNLTTPTVAPGGNVSVTVESRRNN
jgi:hypothetical protein